MMERGYPRIGEVLDPGYPIYELRIYDFLDILDPPHGYVLPKMDPQEYYITSGDALQKTRYLSKVLWEYAGKARAQLKKMRSPTQTQTAFEKSCWAQAGAANRLITILTKIRGSDVFLETEWTSDHVLTVLRKNPRSRQLDEDSDIG